MANDTDRKAAERPAFHFPPMKGVRPHTIRFQVVACLADCSRVNIGSTATRADAESVARLISPTSGIRVEIVGTDEKT